MTPETVLGMLDVLDQRLHVLADQARRSSEMALETYAQVKKLETELVTLRKSLLAVAETRTHQAVKAPRPN